MRLSNICNFFSISLYFCLKISNVWNLLKSKLFSLIPYNDKFILFLAYDFWNISIILVSNNLPSLELIFLIFFSFLICFSFSFTDFSISIIYFFSCLFLYIFIFFGLFIWFLLFWSKLNFNKSSTFFLVIKSMLI